PAGWSIITNPFYNTSIDINNTGLPLAWYWDGRAYKLVAHLPADALNVAAGTTLEAWRGYFVYRQQESSITIRRQAQSTGVVESLALGGKNAALIQLVARAEGAEDAVNVCGVGESEVKVPNPPRIPGSVDIYFVNGDGEPLAMDVRTGGIAGQRWELVVETDLPNTQVTVSAPDLSRIPADYAVVLTDPSTGRKTYLRTSGGYVFTSGSDGARRRLILEVVPRGQTTVIGGVTAQQVGRGRVVVTYQLTGSAAVTAQVLNIAGRPIRTLVADKAQTAGQHTIGWNLDNEAGSPVPAGTYLIVLQARTEDGQQVKVVRPLAVSR
ncbi:MAG: hypothetical protein H5T86_15520, partial [Armatimonadetes bacterium]|nr:hypothetical protein [Armatimonadota bacterium]